MGFQTERVIVPARFMVTVGHLLAVFMAFWFQDVAVYAGLGDSPSMKAFDAAETSLNRSLILALCCMAIDFIGLFTGVSLFFEKISVIQIIAHFIGGIYTSWFITNSWAYQKMWYIVALCNVIPTIFELWALMAVFVFQIVVF